MRASLGLVGALAVAVPLAGAQGAALSADYLAGRWTTGEAAACTQPGAELTEFRPDGSFTTLRDGRAVAVGFWRVDGDRLDLEVLAHDNLHDALQGIEGEYGHFTIAALVFDVAEDRHRMVQSIGSVLQGLDVVRCP